MNSNQYVANFEEIRNDDDNPYSASLITEEHETLHTPDHRRIRRLRFWLVVLTLAILFLALTGYVTILFFHAAEAAESRKDMEMMTWINGICFSSAVILCLALMFVVYRLARVLEYSRGMSIFYALISSSNFIGSDRSPTAYACIIPMGMIVITVYLCIHAHNVLSNQSHHDINHS